MDIDELAERLAEIRIEQRAKHRELEEALAAIEAASAVVRGLGCGKVHDNFYDDAREALDKRFKTAAATLMTDFFKLSPDPAVAVAEDVNDRATVTRRRS